MSLRAPRAVLSVAGGSIVPIEVTVEMTTYRKADTFMARVALDSTPGLDEFFWSALTDTSITINATNDATNGGLSPLFVGNVDVVDINWNNRTAQLSGRDLGAALLETKTSEQFQNQTTEQIVQTIAGRVGLTAQVTVPSGDKVGLTYQTDYTRITDQDALLNVLSRLAQRSGCVFFVVGKTLFFMPSNQVTGGTYTVQYVAPDSSGSIAQGNFIGLKTRRNYVLARNITVRTRSWQLKQKQSVVSEFDMKGSATGAKTFEFRAPNMTKQQADAYSQGRLNDITSREKTVEIDAPGDISLTPEMQLLLTGTGTSFDQIYAISRVSHQFDQGGGYRMSISTRAADAQRTITQKATASTPSAY